MKMAREHVVPLAPAVVALLKEVRAYSSANYVFVGEKSNQPISRNTMIYACYRMGYRGRQTVHGFRGLASTWANEAECYQPDWIEMALAHVERDEVRGRITLRFIFPRAGACSMTGPGSSSTTW
ncbi:tyrosine-type recombinase/integrase [Sphingomonas yabuuchiae]|uniref:Integrase n=2 Tax=Sphingomonas yabuuchiae TaxID=172044 RepID=A0ABR6KEI1_9SPHN|nr:tyrosine-type recombinase/integrase [Sphingomonas yabuuchiae]MBB4611540.1 integrase [Sphingomonas yabuuchiae]